MKFIYILLNLILLPRVAAISELCAVHRRDLYEWILVRFGLFMFYCLNFIRQWLENLQQFNILI